MTALLALLATLPQTYPDRPGDFEFVVDQAGLLRPDDVAALRKLCREALEARRAPILVVTIPSLPASILGEGMMPIEWYASELFRRWGIGWPEWNHGMLLLVSTGDRKARIEMGAGWRHRMDGDAQRIMDELVVPNFKRGDFSRGIVEGVKGLQALATGLQPPRGATRDRACGRMDGLAWPIILVVAIAVLGSMFRGGSRYGSGGCNPFGMGCLGAMFGSMLGNFLTGSGVRDSWGSGGGSGWGGGSFGGGSSGGGGASGSW